MRTTDTMVRNADHPRNPGALPRPHQPTRTLISSHLINLGILFPKDLPGPKAQSPGCRGRELPRASGYSLINLDDPLLTEAS